jgi:hypothetical protein
VYPVVIVIQNTQTRLLVRLELLYLPPSLSSTFVLFAGPPIPYLSFLHGIIKTFGGVHVTRVEQRSVTVGNKYLFVFIVHSKSIPIPSSSGIF